MHRFRYLAITLCFITATVFIASCEKEGSGISVQVNNPAKDEAAIRAADAAWQKVAQAKDVEGWVANYTDNATLMLPGAPAARGKDAIRKAVTAAMADHNFAVTFGPTKIEVSKSGDLAYDLGTYSLTGSDAKGKPQSSNGLYLVVWMKQADGNWKAIIDYPGTTTQ
jgi:uncharacterized protein (TIGR02246 family)